MSRSKLNFGVIGAGGIARRKTIPGMAWSTNRACGWHSPKQHPSQG